MTHAIRRLTRMFNLGVSSTIYSRPCLSLQVPNQLAPSRCSSRPLTRLVSATRRQHRRSNLAIRTAIHRTAQRTTSMHRKRLDNSGEIRASTGLPKREQQ
eukprot:6984673-Prymnesium_polylepis.1